MTNVDYRGQVTLWIAVIEAAVDDYKAGRLAWSYFLSRDFVFICGLAETDPVNFRRLLLEVYGEVKPREPKTKHALMGVAA